MTRYIAFVRHGREPLIYRNASKGHSARMNGLSTAFKEAEMLSKHGCVALLAAVALAILNLTTAAQTQPYGPGRGGAGMMGPGMMDRQLFGRMCGPRMAGFAEWRLERMERVIKPTEAQRAKFDEFKAASNKAAEAMRTACPTDVPTTMVGRMEAMEKRLDAMLQAVKTVRPTLEAFYATLSDEQKANLNVGRGPGRFWHWRDRW
jgi:hypothetical protein